MEVSDHLRAPAALPLVKEPPVLTGLEAGWAPESVWTQWTPLPGIEPRPVAVAILTELSRLSKIKNPVSTSLKKPIAFLL
jgi:hypothetical protein